ncbi:MAG: hypothetical protein SPH94_02245 [Fusobacterium necrophorum]|nr:hypothetical protein [Fusobacterium necrophorum]
MNYDDFITSKSFEIENSGFDIEKEILNENLYDFQKDIVKWALKKGKTAIFADCGLGKTLMQLEWAHQIYKNNGLTRFFGENEPVGKKIQRPDPDPEKYAKKENIKLRVM